MTPPPTPTPALPAAPGGLSATRVCKTLLGPPPHLEMTNAVLSWNDKADNEAGYNIYRDGSLIATLDPDSESFTDADPPGLDHTYWVEAFNEAGSSNQKKIDVACP
ncbi:MAG: hypothetical protein A2Z03_10130 [Chloroflexi bacterium RBG_16_56_8]|nr:MAG: hypothetical protein A2Z03_10130 [Chloroflexi bacterium RBG_16_56_8]